MSQDTLVNEWDRQHRVTVRVMERIPESQRDWKPHPKSMSTGGLCWHLVSAEHMFIQAVLNGQFGDKQWKLPSRPDSVQETIAAFDENHSALHKALRELPEGAWSKRLSFVDRWHFPARQFVAVCMGHEIHHRGQLTVYLRLLGESVPSVYGPSADEQAVP